MKLGLLFINDDVPFALLQAKISNSKIIDTECIQKAYMSIENLQLLQQSICRLIKCFENNNNHCLCNTENAPLQKDLPFVQRLDSILSNHLADESFSIDTLSEELYMSRSCLFRKVKSISGMSPHEYIKTIKMNRAIELLQQGNKIAEVSEQLGFSSPSYFAKCFKKQFDILPKDILKRDKD